MTIQDHRFDVTLVYDDNKIWLDFSDVTLVYDEKYKIIDFGDVTLGYDWWWQDYMTRVQWCNISVWWQNERILIIIKNHTTSPENYRISQNLSWKFLKITQPFHKI